MIIQPETAVMLYLVYGTYLVVYYEDGFTFRRGSIVRVICETAFILFWLPLIITAIVMRIHKLFRSR